MFSNNFWNPEDKLKDRLEYADIFKPVTYNPPVLCIAKPQFKRQDIRYYFEPLGKR